MSETTTVRVSRATRDHLNKVSTEQGETVDATIQRGLDLLEREQWRRTAELDAWAASQDVEDQAELRAAMADLAGE
jgi:predicted transcriptional regulator